MVGKLRSALLGALLALGAAGAQATVILPGSETPLQQVINSLYGCTNCSPVAAAPNVTTDQYANDQLWTVEASGGGVATLVIELAGNKNTNTFGIYDALTGNRVQLFNGAADDADQVLFSLSADGSIDIYFRQRSATGALISRSATFYDAGYFTGNSFGFYLGTVGGTFYSETAKNAGGADQMVAFQGDNDRISVPGNFAGSNWGSSSFILAWEDIAYARSDKDFNDFVVYVESVRGVPEPGTLALLGLGLAGLGIARRRRA